MVTINELVHEVRVEDLASEPLQRVASAFDRTASSTLAARYCGSLGFPGLDSCRRPISR